MNKPIVFALFLVFLLQMVSAVTTAPLTVDDVIAQKITADIDARLDAQNQQLVKMNEQLVSQQTQINNIAANMDKIKRNDTWSIYLLLLGILGVVLFNYLFNRFLAKPKPTEANQ